MNERKNAISIHNLSKHFGDFIAVDNISFDVTEGEIFGLLGSNGSGKTTTIRMLCGILTPTSGEADILGNSIHAVEKIKQQLGYMSQKFSLYEELSVEQNLDFYAAIYDVPKATWKSRRDELLEISDLSGKGKLAVSSLPGGIRQRLALACAIVHNPPLLFLDEATSGIDPEARRSFWALLYSFAGKGMTIIVTTHFMEEAEHCNRIAFLTNGQLTACETPEGLKKMTGKASMEEVFVELFKKAQV